MKETITGFKKRGSWSEVVQFGNLISEALDEVDITNADRREWEKWKPKPNDSFNSEMEQKTASQASVKNNDKDVFEYIRQTKKEIENKSMKDAMKNTQKASKQTLGEIEHFVYRNVMTFISPQYFDNTLINAELNQVSDDTYVFEVNFADDSTYEQVKPFIKKSY